MLNGPFPPWPHFTQEEAKAVSDVLLSGRVNYWTGQEGRAFEREFAEFAGTKHAIALANGTVALDLALHGFGIGAANGGSASDEVIVTPRSFMASVSSVVNAGARPVFAEVDPDSGNINPETVAPVITDNTRAILCVHLAGWPCDMDGLRAVAGTNIRLIEDCAQAHGAMYKGQPVGGLGDAAAWSFCQDKIMTTGGEGGMVTCNDEELWRRMWAFKDHGKSYEAVYERDHAPGFRWLHESFGTNWRLTEMQSAIGRIQLRRMPDWQAARGANAEALIAALRPFLGTDGPIRLPLPDPEIVRRHAWYKLYAYVRPENLNEGWDRDRIAAEITAMGVPCMQGSCSEIYREKAFKGTGLRPEARLPIAQQMGETSLMFLVHPGLEAKHLERAAAVITDVLGRAKAPK
ncbi:MULTISPECIES: DegT/DnrJ/EryC1/StrS aminotransferase family protein [unclassified Sulfitobacter]|uniref:DegT/DnrJ/EryC1/StrS family aminotransferase n=1 Tax=unclassified Sulfitobacter TaxID=196795 RepID=UPI0023E24443|nr:MULTISPECIES: DegT/DnrJ/EryC1/StrS aminotransferase family protein [unclassified Sulfitobacter]MDF3384588.1 DegT/DnrJ/EryC1/StrS aminotransferase family protein [Sulfitobacter sp. Ks11]MDF3388077.1 DegT/DnrJ/EryC1/StrS aminotransferase family protein [Sulfitobacter sp. M85]MDF3391497.1 DegT/DnrJ/EryC1/StrS aminotransferase family protein [Sulfitobacter sp. Ks16]MDF3402064.1 DegT/DnrJ/EryC1/StrS aminotransferase family protein [Sulfitobacter sp. KE39]MDF3405556.1 DegT/DnrJ/EryC1/StrS aminotr